MLLFTLATLSGWLLFTMFSHNRKGTIPGWLHKFMYAERYIHDPNKKRVFRSTLGWCGLIFSLMLAPMFIVLGLLQFLFGSQAWDVFGHSSVLSTATTFIGLATPFYFGRNIRGHFNHYSIDVVRQEKEQTVKEAYGAKEWATDQDIQRIIGPKRTHGIHIGNGWHWNEKGHILTVGGSGQGKGVSGLLPALLSDGLINAGISVVCLDPKGENAAIAAPHLIKQGYDVHILNPCWIKEVLHLGNSQFNPFDLFSPEDPDASRLYDLMARAIHNRDGHGESSFFDNRCRQYISLYLAFAHHTQNGHFDAVYTWLKASGSERMNLLASMASDETFNGAASAKAISDRLTGDAAKTEENIYGTIDEAIDIFKNENLRGSLRRSDFDMREISKRPTAIFVCVPFEDLRYYSAWVRMVFSMLIRTLTRHYNINRKIMVMLDEFPQLGSMKEIPQALAVLRGYNVTLWPVVQDLGQLQRLYSEDWETFIGNSAIKHWLSTGADNKTADYISNRMPQAIRFIGSNADGSPKEKETKLLDSSQVMGFKEIICEISGMQTPAKFPKIKYFDLPFAGKNASPNPFY